MEDTQTADADKQGGHQGQGQGSGRRGAPTGSGPVLEAVGGPDSPEGFRSEGRGAPRRAGILTCRLCGTDTAGGKRKSA